ncbi:CPBP family intramembrane glutamic endopeptidase [Aquimarina mytili]|uniref:CPBP family intramembrane metalloprotease n=1 Tax=Aquimarina mytili TaxID=874423 RepID=A0A937A797_9FLAO|nr:CPBP family intramembrane glutamic endopeptidase [Aquimarina mytili]MBL0686165.1 CPBP family intramembrane metalloprotease [Aquimarina mytili]
MSIAVSPLILIRNSHLQFLGAVLILVLGLYLNSKYLDKIDFSEYGLIFKKETFIHLIIGIFIGAISVVLILLLGKEMDFLTVSKVNPDFRIKLSLLFALKMFLVGILEETFFRGYLFTNIYNGLKSRVVTNRQRFLIALLASSTFFGLAHINTNNANLISIVFLSINGMVWCIPFAITKNLGLSIGLHSAWNFAQTQIGFIMSGNKAKNSFFNVKNNAADLFTGGEYGPEAGILGLIGFAIMLILVLIYLKLIRKIT